MLHTMFPPKSTSQQSHATVSLAALVQQALPPRYYPNPDEGESYLTRDPQHSALIGKAQHFQHPLEVSSAKKNIRSRKKTVNSTSKKQGVLSTSKKGKIPLLTKVSTGEFPTNLPGSSAEERKFHSEVIHRHSVYREARQPAARLPEEGHLCAAI